MLTFTNFLLTLFHVASEPTHFTFQVSSPTSSFVIVKDRDLKFGEFLKVTLDTKPDFFIRQPAFC